MDITKNLDNNCPKCKAKLFAYYHEVSYGDKETGAWYVECEECQGKRYMKEVLEVQYKGKSIAEVLEMTVDAGDSEGRVAWESSVAKEAAACPTMSTPVVSPCVAIQGCASPAEPRKNIE